MTKKGKAGHRQRLRESFLNLLRIYFLHHRGSMNRDLNLGYQKSSSSRAQLDVFLDTRSQRGGKAMK